jgi:hypothetical protein
MSALEDSLRAVYKLPTTIRQKPVCQIAGNFLVSPREIMHISKLQIQQVLQSIDF